MPERTEHLMLLSRAAEANPVPTVRSCQGMIARVSKSISNNAKVSQLNLPPYNIKQRQLCRPR